MNSKSEENENENGKDGLRNNFDLTDEAQEGMIKIFKYVCDILPFTQKENRFDHRSFLFVLFCFGFNFWRILSVEISFDANDNGHAKYFFLIIGLYNGFLCVFKLMMAIRQEYFFIIFLTACILLFQTLMLLTLYSDFNERNYKAEKELEYVCGFTDFCFMMVVFFNMIFHNPQKQQQPTTEPKEIEKND